MDDIIIQVTDEDQSIIKDLIIACGYAQKCDFNGKYIAVDDGPTGVLRLMGNVDGKLELIYPLSNKKPSSVQADALERYISKKEFDLWNESSTTVKIIPKITYPIHIWRFDRLHWVIKQLYLRSINTSYE